MRSSPLAVLMSFLAALTPAAAQGGPPEIDELRRRVAAIRAEMAQITAVADYATDIFTRDTTARFLFSAIRNPALRAEFDWHTGASPDMRDADDSAAHGVVLLPVSSWETSAFGVSALIERYQSAGHPVIVIGSRAGQSGLLSPQHLVTNGAPDGSRASATINEAANLIAMWTLHMEFIASATRHHWQPGVYVSILVPSADDSNYKARFRTPTSAPVVPIVAGQLGNQYLDRVDSLLKLATRPEHQVLMQRAADSLRAVRMSGRPVFVGACAHYLQAGLPGDTVSSPFRPVRAQYDVVPGVQERGGRRGDAVLWFGYLGYDCPHLAAAGPLQDAGFKVVVVTDSLPKQLPGNVIAAVPLGWHLPEHIGTVPFNAEGVGSASSVEALVHYLWLKRLVAAP